MGKKLSEAKLKALEAARKNRHGPTIGPTAVATAEPTTAVASGTLPTSTRAVLNNASTSLSLGLRLFERRKTCEGAHAAQDDVPAALLEALEHLAHRGAEAEGAVVVRGRDEVPRMHGRPARQEVSLSH